MTFLETFIALALFLWLAVAMLYTLFNQQLSPYTQRWDLFRWISSYQLFSGSPRTFKLFYRERGGDDEITSWRNIPLTSSPKWYHAVWFPEDLVLKNIQSVIDSLVSFIEARQNTEALNRIRERFMYKTICRYVQGFADAKYSVERQFKIEEVKRMPGREISMEIFVSNFDKE
jgi:hypothetical protein